LRPDSDYETINKVLMVWAVLSMLKCVASVAVVVAAFAFATPAVASEGKFNIEYGKTLPPIGFVKFCASNHGECQKKDFASKKIEMTSEQWKQLYTVNSSINERIKPMSDQDLYGQPEFWTYPATAGDCEDYLLLKKRELEKLGYSPSNLLITVVLDEKGEGHAVLTVATTEGDYILDNRRNDIYAPTDTGYNFLKRQSRKHPLEWVSLRKGKITEKTVAAK
jgi:predicted transglutaminase-like cysteine proteinase